MASDRESRQELPSSWTEFLSDLDAALRDPVELHCVGGFVVSLYFGFPRPTGDVDYVSAIPHDKVPELEALAGRGSKLEKHYRIHLQHVTVATMPEDYQSRLSEMFPGRLAKLKLLAPDPYDLVLSKLERNSPKDQEDVEYLAKSLSLNSAILTEHYEREFRPNLMARQSWHDGTLKRWIELYFS